MIYSNVKQIEKVSENVQIESNVSGIEGILKFHSITNDALRKDLEEYIRSTVTQITDENITLRSDLSNTKDQVNQIQDALNKLESCDQERSNTICSALKNISSLTTNTTDMQLTKIQKQQLSMEIKIVEDLHNLGLKNITESEDLNLIVNELFFQHVADEVEEQCPLFTQIVKLLFIEKRPETNTAKKTDAFKFKSALHIINALGKIRSQLRTTDEFGLMFGLLLISYGCGRAVLDAIHALGLCKSYDF
ncbi:Hypothetical predicted protein [Paramuricea clavata]|uniref:Uncharacterized protein n=1 Tax=Paramuricea clavata TaxID=317549 RepID=A0A7D9HT72_PARCT|nr:Hypothetical predicted protein [Paramuricea clavata]